MSGLRYQDRPGAAAGVWCITVKSSVGCHKTKIKVLISGLLSCDPHHPARASGCRPGVQEAHRKRGRQVIVYSLSRRSSGERTRPLPAGRQHEAPARFAASRADSSAATVTVRPLTASRTWSPASKSVTSTCRVSQASHTRLVRSPRRPAMTARQESRNSSGAAVLAFGVPGGCGRPAGRGRTRGHNRSSPAGRHRGRRPVRSSAVRVTDRGRV